VQKLACPNEVHQRRLRAGRQDVFAANRGDPMGLGKNLHLYDAATARLTRSYDVYAILEAGGVHYTEGGKRLIYGTGLELWDARRSRRKARKVEGRQGRRFDLATRRRTGRAAWGGSARSRGR
jgi:hypothetical protein